MTSVLDDWAHVADDPDSYTLAEQKRIACSILPVIFERSDETYRVFAEHDYFVGDVHFDAYEVDDDRHHYRGRANLYTDQPDADLERLNKALSCFAPCFVHKASVSVESRMVREMMGDGLVAEVPLGRAWHVLLEVQLVKSDYHRYLAVG